MAKMLELLDMSMRERLQRVHESRVNVQTLLRAAWGAATGKAIDTSPTKQYLERLNKESRQEYNPDEAEISRLMSLKTIKALSKNRYTKDDLLTVPWSSRRIRPTRLAASLIAFSNDHGKRTVPEFFPVEEILCYLQAVKVTSLKIGRQLTIPDQFSLALQQTNNNPVAAALLAHSAYRSVARSSDTRFSQKLAFDVESNENKISMMDIVRSTTDFTGNKVRDPLGNTYHFWSQFSAGMIFSLLRNRHPVQVGVYNSAFSHGPELHVALRQNLLGMPLTAGDHTDANLQGMRTGREIGKLLIKRV